MKKLCFLAVASLLLFMVSCEKPVEPDPVPQYDTIVRIVDTIRVDTVQVDTLYRDTSVYVENDRRIVGYVAYYSDKVPDPHLVTHLCYSFAELYMSEDSVYQQFKIKGDKSRFERILRLKEENPNLKILLSFSHTISNPDNAHHGGFSKLSADSLQRRHFAEDCLAFCREWGLDGIDIDWEFPGLSWSGNHCDPAHDVQNHVLLMRDLRAVLGNDYLLTYAAGVRQPVNITGGKSYIDNKAVEKYVDFINIMTYDMCSAPQPHNGYDCDGYWDIKRTYNSYKGIRYPMEKINLGIPFYGRHTYEDGEWTYSRLNIYYRIYPNQWERRYNHQWWTPVAYKDGQMWCSYDDEQSIAQKSKWVKEVGMGGLMYWEISGDDSNLTLSHACWDGMKMEKETIVDYVFHTDTVFCTDTIITIVPRTTDR